jgi:hypothetical protein
MYLRKADPESHSAEAAQLLPDLNKDDVSADQLPIGGWLDMVDDLMNKRQYRLALRACFLAQLAQLADLGRIKIARFKTNCDYEQELARYKHVQSQLYDGFHCNRLLFENIWYGTGQAGQSQVDEFRKRMDQVQRAGL